MALPRSDALVVFGATGRRPFESAEGAYASWRIVDRVIKTDLPVFDYAPGTWGPREAKRVLPGGTRWHDPEPE